MRSLKKTLTLVLVFAMAIGLLTAGAQDFSDAADIQYKEAVEVMTGIGAINGRPDGTFDPEGLITRAEAAKLVAYTVLTRKVAELLPRQASSFTDVASTHWASPFIEYCVSQGIIKGRGAGKFDPNGNVTAFELAAMLLRAVGYGKNGEYEGASWSINVLTDAVEKGIFTGSAAANYGAPATREEAALYFFNTINPVSGIDQVNWDKTIDDYVLSAKGKIGAKYLLTKDTAPVNGVNGYTWKIGTKAVSSFFATENVLGTSTDGTTIANLSTKTHAKFIAERDTVVTYVINGATIPEYADGDAYAVGDVISYQGNLYTVTIALTAGDTSAALTTNAALYTIVKGTVVKFINTDTDAKVEKISLTEKTVAQAGAAPSVNPTTGAVTIAGLPGSPFAKDTVVYPADLAANDYVLMYTDYSSGTAIVRIEKATKVTGQMTSANTVAGTIMFAGKAYAESGLVTAGTVVPVFYGVAGNFNVDAVAWLDDNGDIVAIETVAQTGPAAKYGLLVGYLYTPGTGTLPFVTPATAKALLYTEDGTVAVYNVAKGAGGVVPDQSATFTFGAAPYGYLVQYAINDSGEVTLTAVATTGTVAAAGTAKSPVINIDPTGATPASNFYITSTTKVIYFDDTTAYSATTNAPKFVTGYANTDAAVAAKNVTYVVVPGTNNLAVVLIGQAPASVTIPGNYAYVHTVNESVRYVNGVAFYDYNVYVNGVATTLTSAESGLFAAAGLYSYTLNSNGLVIGPIEDAASAPAVVGAVAATGKVEYVEEGFVAYVEGGVNKSIATTSATKFLKVTATGVVEEAIAASSTYTTYTITYIQPSTIPGVAAAIYFVVS